MILISFVNYINIFFEIYINRFKKKKNINRGTQVPLSCYNIAPKKFLVTFFPSLSSNKVDLPWELNVML